MNARAAKIVGCFFLLAARAARAEDHAKPLIQIAVEVVEVDEQKTQGLGIQWLSDILINETKVPSVFAIGPFTRGALSADIQFLEQQGAADLLANPKLVARDGTEATFHAGGEIPYATASSLGTVTVEFKAYGVDLKINPHQNDAGQIEMSVTAGVSGPDTQNGVSLSGNTVPAIRTRQASSQLTMAPGSTLTMAGMLQDEKEWTRVGVPGLMNVPFLKYFFSHKQETHRKTSVVIFVTPTLFDMPKSPVVRKPSESDDDLLSIEHKKDMGILHG